MDKIITESQRFKCQECGNEVAVPADKELKGVFECEYCGIEYVKQEVLGNGEFSVTVIEDEK